MHVFHFTNKSVLRAHLVPRGTYSVVSTVFVFILKLKLSVCIQKDFVCISLHIGGNPLAFVTVYMY